MQYFVNLMLLHNITLFNSIINVINVIYAYQNMRGIAVYFLPSAICVLLAAHHGQSPSGEITAAMFCITAINRRPPVIIGIYSLGHVHGNNIENGM